MKNLEGTDDHHSYITFKSVKLPEFPPLTIVNIRKFWFNKVSWHDVSTNYILQPLSGREGMSSSAVGGTLSAKQYPTEQQWPLTSHPQQHLRQKNEPSQYVI